MFLIRLLFAFCLLCFIAKQSGYVVKAHERSKITCELPSDDCEDKEEDVEKTKVESLFKTDRQIYVYTSGLLATQVLIPAVSMLYNEFLHATVSPPPDHI